MDDGSVTVLESVGNHLQMQAVVEKNDTIFTTLLYYN
jgi:hypothetical protein